MFKYDFGYELHKGSTNEWAFNAVKKSSTVLELGASVGTLAKHLVQDKDCIVDIVEMDNDAGQKAQAFARIARIGADDGNLEKDNWYKEFKNESYDYIIMLDVLEHINNPLVVLLHVKQLLKSDGIFLCSVPNIAHNSVLINLFNNKFRYTDVGLLDNTHIHFYTYESLQMLLQEAEFIPVQKEAIQIPVTMTEIPNSYEDVPPELEEAFRKRAGADIYQFLYTMKKNTATSKEGEFEFANHSSTLYQLYFYWNGTAENNFHYCVNPENIDITVSIPSDTNLKFVRIDPIEFPCIITRLEVTAETDDGTIFLPIASQNGFPLGNNSYAYCQEKPMLIYNLTASIRKIHCNFKCSYIKANILKDLQELEQRTISESAAKENEIRALSDKVNKMLNKEKDQKDYITSQIQKQMRKNMWTGNGRLRKRKR